MKERVLPDGWPWVVLIVNFGWVAWKFRSRLMRELRSAGYRIAVLTHFDGYEDQLRLNCDIVVDVPLVAARIDPVADLRTLFSYLIQLRSIKPVAVLTFTIKPNIYGSLAARMLSIPVVANVTGLGSVQKTGAFVALVVRNLYRIAFARSACVFFQNPDDMSSLIGEGLVQPESAQLLPGSGVDTDEYVPRTVPERQGEPVVFCMMARLLREKGVVEFAQAAEQLVNSGLPARFELWGLLDPADSRCITAAEISCWERRGILVFRGPARDAKQAFASVDVVVLPSYYPEGTPRTLLEAAALGLPSITSDMPGCRDAVVDGRTGLLCRPRDVDSLAEAMRAMVKLGASGRSSYGRQGRAHVIARFDERIVVEAYLGVLAVLGRDADACRR
jgi:glycosyltransferase involved in cell wall biosynthesis